MNTLTIIRCEKDGSDGNNDRSPAQAMHGNSYFTQNKAKKNQTFLSCLIHE